MLILTDADGFRIDLDKLCQGVLQTACNRNRAALCDVKIGEFVLRKLGSGIDTRARFADDGVGNFAGKLGQRVGNELFAFARCRAVTDGDDVNFMFVN